MKIFAVYRNGKFFGAVKIHPDEEARKVLMLQEAGKRRHLDELVIKEAPTIPIELMVRRLKADDPNIPVGR